MQLNFGARPRQSRSPSDPLTPPRLRRMSSSVDESHLLRIVMDGNISILKLVTLAKKSERKGIQ